MLQCEGYTSDPRAEKELTHENVMCAKCKQDWIENGGLQLGVKDRLPEKEKNQSTEGQINLEKEAIVPTFMDSFEFIYQDSAEDSLHARSIPTTGRRDELRALTYGPHVFDIPVKSSAQELEKERVERF